MPQSRLFVKILSAMLAVIAVLSAAIWFFSVPMIERRAYEIELDASRTILDNVYEMAAEMAGGPPRSRRDRRRHRPPPRLREPEGAEIRQ